jgi:hypothetical protein
MSILEVILTSNIITFYWIHQGRFPEKLDLQFKPFNCDICLSAWIGAILYFLPSYVQYPLLALFGSGMIAPFFRNFLTNIYYYKLK